MPKVAYAPRFAEAEALLREALDQSASMRMAIFYSQMIVWLSEARLLAGAVAAAGELADEALGSTRERHEAGLEGWALRLVAEVATQREPLDVARAEGLYQQAMQRADALGLRPLTARCHLGLGILYRRAGKNYDARANLATASSLFRDMQMRLWSERVDAELRKPAGY